MDDSYLKYCNILCKRPEILKPQQHIVLLSHMRANTSLIGHILGDNPAINGYYEMHMGYYSYKSLYRQKFNYFEKHPEQDVKPFMFDKVLHNEHAISDRMLQHSKMHFLISIRKPEVSIKSTVAQFRNKRPGHEYTCITTAAKYYVDRLKMLQEYARKIEGRFCYYDAECVVSSPDKTFPILSNYLGLSTPLKKVFKAQNLTGKGTSGDHSGNLLRGEIVKRNNTYDDILVPASQLQEAVCTYNEVRDYLIRSSKVSSVENVTTTSP